MRRPAAPRDEGKRSPLRVYTASIERARTSASRSGVGAVMGDKGVKAIAIRGTKDINIARFVEFWGLCNEVRNYTKFRSENPVPNVTTILQALGSPEEMLYVDEKWQANNFMWEDGRMGRKESSSKEKEHKPNDAQLKVRSCSISCYNCPLECGAVVTVPGISTYGMSSFSKLTYTMAAFVDDFDFGFRIAQKAMECGVDGVSTPRIMAFAFELKDAGILTDSDFEGCPSDYEGRFSWLLDAIVRREGIGDILADGMHVAAKRIGKGAEGYAHNNIKNHGQLPLGLGVLNPLYFLAYATGEKADMTQIDGQFPHSPFMTKEEREEFVRDWIQVPDEKFKQYLPDWEPRGERSNPNYPTCDMSVAIVNWQEMMHSIEDALGVCDGFSSFPLKAPYHIHNYPKLIAAATGIDMDEEGLEEIYRRNRNLLRAINVRRGLRRSDARPPENRWQKEPEIEERLLDGYYKFKGWDNQGIPRAESLKKLDLGYVAEDLERRGILGSEEH